MGSDVVYNHADFRAMSKRALQALVSYPGTQSISSLE